MEHKFKKFQKVVYDGLVATIINCGKTYKGTLTYDLISDENEELTCIAPEEDCIAYNGEFIDQTFGGLVLRGLCTKFFQPRNTKPMLCTGF